MERLLTSQRSAALKVPACAARSGKRNCVTSHSPQLHTKAGLLEWLAGVSRQMASTFCNHLERLIPSTSLNLMQQGNFAPVSHECPPQTCIMDEHYGPLPPFLHGIYVRNGPNQQFASCNDVAGSSHPFDGDGMLHAVTFHPSGAPPSYCCRYVHTSRFLQEQAAQQSLFTKTFSSLTATAPFVATAHMGLAVLRHILGLVNLAKGMGLANTNLVFHHGTLLALAEDDLPYALGIDQSNGDLINRGRYSFNGSFRPRTMTSHPKVDPKTGEMVCLSYNAFVHPYLTFFRVSTDGTLSKSVPIHLTEPCMIHDFAITPNFIIFPETQLVFQPLDMLRGKAPIKWSPTKMQRFGVLRRDTWDNSAVQWFDVPGCNAFHIINAWEEESNLHTNSTVKEEIVIIFPNLSSPEELVNGNFNGVKNILTEVRLDTKKGTSIHRPLLSGHYANNINVEMGTINENFRGVKNRFVYIGLIGSSLQTYSGVVKLNFESRRVVARRMFDDGYFASEPMFVPKASFIESKEARQEDEGCILCFLHRDNVPDAIANGKDATACQMLVLDSQSPTLEVMASIKLPRRVPYGFHGLFVPHSALNSTK